MEERQRPHGQSHIYQKHPCLAICSLKPRKKATLICFDQLIVKKHMKPRNKESSIKRGKKPPQVWKKKELVWSCMEDRCCIRKVLNFSSKTYFEFSWQRAPLSFWSREWMELPFYPCYIFFLIGWSKQVDDEISPLQW